MLPNFASLPRYGTRASRAAATRLLGPDDSLTHRVLSLEGRRASRERRAMRKRQALKFTHGLISRADPASRTSPARTPRGARRSVGDASSRDPGWGNAGQRR